MENPRKSDSLDEERSPGEETDTRRLLNPETGDEPALSQRNRLCLIVIGGNTLGEVHRLKSGDTILGRSRHCTIRLEEDGVSRKHARIRVSREQVTMDDLGSSNGTFVNGRRVTEVALGEGDKIRIGSATVLKFTHTDHLDETFQRQMYNAALRDGLTNTFNKPYLVQRLDNEFAYARRHKSHLSLIMFDVDLFKSVNEAHGRHAGDFVLSQIARRVQWALRAEDVLARYGGERFCVISRGVPLEGVSQLAERLRSLVESQKYVFDTALIRVSISVGVAGFPEADFESPDALLAAADAALVRAKRAGRNKVVIAGAR